MVSPNFSGGLLNETLSFSSVKLDGPPAEASVQQSPDAERTVFLRQPLSPYVIHRVRIVFKPLIPIAEDNVTLCEALNTE
jgi:hypothetical protein